MRLLTVFLISFPSSTLAEVIYKWTDENGTIHFSDSIHTVPPKYRDQLEHKEFKEDKSPAKSKSEGDNSGSDNRTFDSQREKQKLNRYEVPFKAYEGTAKRIIVSVTFNDSVTAPMAIDTGAPGMMISPKLAEKLGVFRTDEGTLLISAGGIGGSVPAIRTIIDKVQVGGASDRFIPTTVTPSISGSFEGLIGLDFMAKYSITVNHKQKVLVFEEIPPDQNSPGGHDEQWWRNTFREFNDYRDYFRKYGEAVDKRIMDTPFGGGGRFERLKRAVEWQYTQADKLLNRLDHYASEHSVPRHWR